MLYDTTSVQREHALLVGGTCVQRDQNDTYTDILAKILADTSDACDFRKLFLWQAERHADILATILARMSVSVSASWNASLTGYVTLNSCAPKKPLARTSCLYRVRDVCVLAENTRRESGRERRRMKRWQQIRRTTLYSNR